VAVPVTVTVAAAGSQTTDPPRLGLRTVSTGGEVSLTVMGTVVREPLRLPPTGTVAVKVMVRWPIVLLKVSEPDQTSPACERLALCPLASSRASTDSPGQAAEEATVAWT
jgi:hypothetical protein